VTGESELGIERFRNEDYETVVLRGELDLTNVAELERVLFETEAGAVVLDLGDLTYLDSAGIRAIDLAHRRFAEQGRSLHVVAPQDSRAAWTFRVAGFAEDALAESAESALGRGAEPA
jgi:anti-anti-sigma factor